MSDDPIEEATKAALRTLGYTEDDIDFSACARRYAAVLARQPRTGSKNSPPRPSAMGDPIEAATAAILRACCGNRPALLRWQRANREARAAVAAYLRARAAGPLDGATQMSAVSLLRSLAAEAERDG